MSFVVALTGVLLKGLAGTVYIGLSSLGFALVVGSLWGLLCLQKVPVLSYALTALSYMIRGLPLMVIFFILYYALPFYGIELSATSTALLGLGLHSSAYIGEILRAGIDAVPKGQWQAAYALGFNPAQTVLYIILPQAWRVCLPAMVGQAVTHIKDTALMSVIGVYDVVRMGRQMMQSHGQPFLIFGMVALFYGVICYPLIRLSEHLEGRFAGGRQQRLLSSRSKQFSAGAA